MDYNNIFINYNKAKKLLSRLFESNDMEYTKKELEKIEDEDLRVVLKTQYLYLFQKKMNLLKDNKSGNIMILEDLLHKIKMKKVDEIVEILNKLGYNMILLVLLNISKEKMLEIKEKVKVNKIEYEELDLEKMEIFNLEEIIRKTVGNIVNKSPNINIEFNNDERNEYIKMKKELEDEEDEDEETESEVGEEAESEVGEDELDESEVGEDELDESEVEEDELNKIDIEEEMKNINEKIPQNVEKHIHKKKNEGEKDKEGEEEIKNIMLSMEDRKWIDALG